MPALTRKLAKLRALSRPEQRLLLTAWLLLPLFWAGLRVLGLQRFQATLDRISPKPVIASEARPSSSQTEALDLESLPLPTVHGRLCTAGRLRRDMLAEFPPTPPAGGGGAYSLPASGEGRGGENTDGHTENSGIPAKMDHLAPPNSPLSFEQITRLGALVNLAARHAPGPATCLTRSLLLRWLLRRRGVESDLRIGVKLDQGRLDAHAWVEAGGIPLNDSLDVAERFAPFAQPLSPEAFN